MSKSTNIAHIFEDMMVGAQAFRANIHPKNSISIHKFDEQLGEFKPLKNFKVGDEVIFSTFWVSSDGPLAGYTRSYTGAIKSITGFYVIVSEAGGGTKRLNFKECVAKNWQ